MLVPLPPSAPVEMCAAVGRPRVRYAVRNQKAMEMYALDELLPEDHRARIVWAYVEGVDLSALYEGIRSVEGRAGTMIEPAGVPV